MVAAAQAEAAEARAAAAYYQGMNDAAATRVSVSNTAPTPETYGLTEEQLATYNEALPVVERVASQRVASALAQQKEEFNAALSEINRRMEVQSAHVAKTTMEQQLYKDLPNLDEIVRSVEYRNRLDKPDPNNDFGMTHRQVITQYIDGGHSKAAASYVNRMMAGASVAPKPQRPAIPAPVGNQAGQPIPPRAGGAVSSISMSKVVGDSGLDQKYRTGKITREAYDSALEAAFSYAAQGVSVTA
jgi:hypothetical protein